MEKLIETLVKGLSPIVTLILLVLVSLSYIFKDKINFMLLIGIMGTREQLKNHDLFTTINKILADDIHKITFENDEAKTQIFKDFIKIKLTEIGEQIIQIINDKKTLTCSKSDYANIMRSLVTKTTIECNRKALETFRKKGLSNDQCYHTLKMFDKWHDDTLKAVYNRINMVLSGTYHKTNYHKTIAVMEIFAMAVELATTDGIRSFEEMNGYFRNIKYE